MILIGGVPVRVSEGWSEAPRKYRRKPTTDPWVQLYRDERDMKRGYCLISERPLAVKKAMKKKNPPKKEFCLRGHPNTPENRMKTINACRLCHNAMQAQKKRDRPKKQYCKNGHKRTPENLYSGGTCKICHQTKMRLKYAPKQEKAA